MLGALGSITIHLILCKKTRAKIQTIHASQNPERILFPLLQDNIQCSLFLTVMQWDGKREKSFCGRWIWNKFKETKELRIKCTHSYSWNEKSCTLKISINRGMHIYKILNAKNWFSKGTFLFFRIGRKGMSGIYQPVKFHSQHSVTSSIQWVELCEPTHFCVLFSILFCLHLT